jgi:hypothetical protein
MIGEEFNLARWLGRCREPEGRPKTPQPARGRGSGYCGEIEARWRVLTRALK